jgi:SAM-dependent methyltransferase
MSNLEDYDDPVIYDSESARFQAEAERTLRFYLDLCLQANGPALELGCGTGRFTLPLAQAGIAITGLDIAPAMLARARAKAPRLSIRWVEADARTFELAERFGLIFESGETFRHLHDRADHEAILARVRAHLRPGGRFVVSAPFPQPDLLQDAPEEQPWFEHTDETGRHIRVSGTYRYDPVGQIAHENAVRRWVNAAGEDVMQHAPLALRVFFPQELEALLHYNGFDVVERFGDWDRSPLTQSSPMIICVCQSRQE